MLVRALIQKKIKLVDIIALIVLAISLIGSLYFGYTKYTSSKHNKTIENDQIASQATSPDVPAGPTQVLNSSTNTTTQAEIPANFKVDVPFMSQAPTYNWDALHEDACEEASILMLYYYINKTNIISRASFEQEIQTMISYEGSHGYNSSINLFDLVKLSESYLGIHNLKVKTANNPKEIKGLIYTNGPIIVGAAGKILDNPNFRNGGPNYHMLVIKGYDQNGFITNDPGTRNGEDYYYKNDNLFESIHDWNPIDITQGEKNLLYIAQ